MLAYSQVLECDALSRGGARATDALDLYRFLIDHRFVLDADAYDFQRRRAVEAVTAAGLQPDQKRAFDRLHERDDLLDAFAKLIGEHARNGDPGTDRDWLMRVGLVPLDSSDPAGSHLFVAYPVGPRNLTALLMPLLAQPGPWTGLGIALIDPHRQAVFASIQPVPVDAQPASDVIVHAPNWRVAAFPSSGSLDDLALRDVTRYAAWLVLVFGTVVTALVLAARSVSRELTLSRLRADFVASVSHELKTPLSLIRMFAESLREGWVTEERKREYYEVITRESERLTGLINNVLDFSRIESGTRHYQLATTDLRDVVVNLVDRYAFHLRAAGIELVRDVAQAPALARVDRDAIEQVIVNLLSNAVKYMGDPGRLPRQVRVSLTRDDTHVRLCVSDTGIGMSDEQRTHIFERYYRADDERVRAVPGSGLGLTLVKAHVEAHAGTIAVKSVPGEGSTFAVTLPLSAQGTGS
jgi:signal transduction histidine kinase